MSYLIGFLSLVACLTLLAIYLLGLSSITFFVTLIALCVWAIADTAPAKQPVVSFPLHPDFLNAIRWVESANGEGNVIGDNGAAIGPYQIHRAYWLDACAYNPQLAKLGTYDDCRYEWYARAVVTAYLNRYCADAIHDNDYEIQARIHHGGPNGALSFYTRRYWNKVEAYMMAHSWHAVRPGKCECDICQETPCYTPAPIEPKPSSRWKCVHCAGADSNDKRCMEFYAGYSCTRPKGHSGDHIACGSQATTHPILTWRDS